MIRFGGFLSNLFFISKLQLGILENFIISFHQNKNYMKKITKKSICLVFFKEFDFFLKKENQKFRKKISFFFQIYLKLIFKYFSIKNKIFKTMDFWFVIYFFFLKFMEY